MLRFWTRLSVWIVGVFLFVGSSFAQDVRPVENLFPNTTVGFVATPDFEYLDNQFNKTQIGCLMADPVMEPFAKDIRRQFKNRFSSVEERLGVTLDDLRKIAGGELGIGRIRPAPGEAALAVVVDVTDRVDKAVALLERISENLTGQGAVRTMIEVSECPDPVIKFDVPAPKSDPRAGPRQTFYCLSGKLLCITDDMKQMQGILAGAHAGRGDSLADVEAFQAVMRRCVADFQGARTQLRWYIHPLSYAEAVRTATPEHDRSKGKPLYEVLAGQGFDAVQGVGGFVDFASESYELVHRTAVQAPPPYKLAMKMLVFPNGRDFAPQRWVPRDIATYSTFYADILNAFDNFDSLFDELVGEGEQGVWQDVLEQLRDDPNGPQIDLREDLVAHLGQRVTILSDYQLPITATSERLLFAIETKNEQAVAAAIQKTMEADETVRRRVVDGRIIWEIIEEKDVPEVPDVPVIDIPSIMPGDDLPEQEEEEEEEDVRLLPHAAVTVFHGHLFIASNVDFLLKVLKPIEERETLTRSIDYRRIDAAIEQLGISQKCARMFSRTDEEYRPTYELIRQGKMPEAETVFARLLNRIFGPSEKDVVRQQEIDGSKMPDYDVVRRNLGPSGMIVTSENDGWFFKGFMLKKE